MEASQISSDTETDPGFDFDAWREKHQTFAAENSAQWARAVTSNHAKAGTKVASVGYNAVFGRYFVA